MVRIKCKKCNNLWDYKGKNPFYAACSRCKTQLNINKNKVIENEQTN